MKNPEKLSFIALVVFLFGFAIYLAGETFGIFIEGIGIGISFSSLIIRDGGKE